MNASALASFHGTLFGLGCSASGVYTYSHLIYSHISYIGYPGIRTSTIPFYYYEYLITMSSPLLHLHVCVNGLDNALKAITIH